MNIFAYNPDKPPNLLRGLFLCTALIVFLILIVSWLILNYQVEQLTSKRTDEYARSITRIVASSSAEALFSEDKLQLKALVESVVKDPYISSATIFSEDGRELIVYPEKPEPVLLEATSLEQKDSGSTSKAELSSSEIVSASGTEQDEHELLTETPVKNFVEREKIFEITPYIEKISYDGVTGGWLKVALDRTALEANFRNALVRSKDWILMVAIALMVLLLLVAVKYARRVRKLAKYNQRFIQLNATSSPKTFEQWFSTLKKLSKIRFELEGGEQSSDALNWLTSQRQHNRIFCYSQFSIDDQESSLVAESLTLAEKYLHAAAQAHGVEIQGNILSGCLVPFFDSTDKEEGLIEVVAFIHLVKELLNSLSLPVKIRAFFGVGAVLVLQNSRAEITGGSLSNRMSDEISRLSSQTQFGEVLSLGIEPEHLESLGEFKVIENILEIPCARLVKVSETLQQQVDRQFRFISQENQKS